MLNRYAIIYPLALVILFALLTFWIDQTVQQQGPKIDGSNRHDPDYILNDFLTTKTDINGKVISVLSADKMQHFPDDDSTELQKPFYTQYTLNKPYTKIQGTRGYVSKDEEFVEFVDDVKVLRQATPLKGEMVLTTNKLTIQPSKNLATTESQVLIKQAPKTVVTGEGLIYDKNNQIFTLKRNVHVHYERPPLQTQNVRAKKTKSKNTTSSQQ